MRIVFAANPDEPVHHIGRYHYEPGVTSPWPDGQGRDAACGVNVRQPFGAVPKVSWAICGEHGEQFLTYVLDDELPDSARFGAPLWSICTDCILALIQSRLIR